MVAFLIVISPTQSNAVKMNQTPNSSVDYLLEMIEHFDKRMI